MSELLRKILYKNKKPVIKGEQTRYKNIEIWVEPGYSEGAYDEPYWSTSSTPLDSNSEDYEKDIIAHIEHEYLSEGNFKKYLKESNNGDIHSWMVDRGFRIVNSKESTVDFYKNSLNRI